MRQHTKDNTAGVIEGILKFLALGGFITTALVLENSAQMFDKPLDKMLNTLDKRQQEREVRRILYYMKRKGLVAYGSEDYEHGIKLTKAGFKRLEKCGYDDLAVPRPDNWDGRWRLVFFDIPEKYKSNRNSFDAKLRNLEFKMLQKSIWVHPFPCRAEIEAASEYLRIKKYISYVEISHIDSSKLLKIRFKKLIK